jgi:F0F1-type ATP synthase gamma subunit
MAGRSVSNARRDDREQGKRQSAGGNTACRQNMGDLLESLNATFHRVRQSGIDEELFDVVAGFEALTSKEN